MLPLIDLLAEVRDCHFCEPELQLGARPVLSVAETARILVIGQAPGTRVHATGIPWNDPSGDRLREWMGINKKTFYDVSRIAIMPMGFCYPGKGRSGDLPPRPECAPRWHGRILEYLPHTELTLLIGGYAQNYYLDKRYKTLTSRVAAGLLPASSASVCMGSSSSSRLLLSQILNLFLTLLRRYQSLILLCKIR